MLCLGIESTAHTIGIGIVDEDFNILSNTFARYRPVNEGIIPWKSAQYLADNVSRVLTDSLKEAKCKLSDIDIIAFSQGPGIGNCLKVSCAVARYLSTKLSLDIICVNHAHAHLEAGRITLGLEDPLVLYLSGGNSQIIVSLKDEGIERFKVLGETTDIGIGNLFDSVARELGFEHAHGSVVEQAAKLGNYHVMPYTVIGMNMSFSGLFTSACKMKSSGVSKEDICRSVMDTAFSMTVEALERALALTQKRNILLCGGVALNKRLREMVVQMAAEHEVKVYVPDDSLNADNGGMIALTGMKLYKRGRRFNFDECYPQPYQRIDEIAV